MSVTIISRSQWGARPWTGSIASVSLSERTEFFVHYDGADPINRTGNAVPQAIERSHLGQGWSGIGYHFVVDQAGNVYEGRGWGLQGAHCPGHNVSGIGVQIAIGGDQAPTDAALRSTRALYDEACAKTGRTLAKRGHKDGFPTLCPGGRLYAWVQSGMPSPGGGNGGATGYVPFPGAEWFKANPVSPIVTAMGRRLVAEGCSAYSSGPGPRWTEADRQSYAKWQRKRGFGGADADGWPGKTTWDALRVPAV
ncbi:peptidoglycan-binding protein [Kitasatospora purpeofusca]|uniref:peptidoglycan-binding protein n=1 Tax=Kitasatospora purpeofusca TaxID=67352 RepID=UPI0022555B0F|nr:peptidoglycan-binding protein [Kitasatospora purpeofusca]MCX4687219.1 peptidoglycan-binding protein [Kitasatospora purpeofusca]